MLQSSVDPVEAPQGERDTCVSGALRHFAYVAAGGDQDRDEAVPETVEGEAS